VQAMKLIQTKPEGFLVISGDDMITLPMVLAGGSGVISVIGEGFPKEFSEMVRLGLNKKVEEAYKLHYKIADAIDMIFEQGNPAGIKEVFKHLGLSENTVRLPLVNVDEKPCTDKIKYAIFYRYLTGLRRTFSGPAIFETYEECKAYCDDLNALNAQKHYEDGVLFHFPG
jgi:dihydrodipicolinate synthase/N-acetylneuraminate lyase